MNSETAIDFCTRRIREQNDYIDMVLTDKDITVERQKDLIYSAHRVKMKLKKVLALLVENQAKKVDYIQKAGRIARMTCLFTEQNSRVHHYM